MSINEKAMSDAIREPQRPTAIDALDALDAEIEGLQSRISDLFSATGYIRREELSGKTVASLLDPDNDPSSTMAKRIRRMVRDLRDVGQRLDDLHGSLDL